MKRKFLNVYSAFLRGINVGGNALVKMGDLKARFEEMGFLHVRTYINSGNVIFESSADSSRELEAVIEKMLAQTYPFQPKVVVRSYEEMERLNKAIPADWGTDPKRRFNVMFLKDSIDSKAILKGLGPKKGIEEVAYHPGALLWSAQTSDLTKTAMVKLSSRDIYQEMTVRNVNTTRKVFELMKKGD